MSPVRPQTLSIGASITASTSATWGNSAGLHLQEMSPFNHPLGAASLGVGSAFASFALYLAFVPPVRYLDWIKQRDLPSEG